MSYQKQGFYSGGDLYASQLEAMEDGIINAENLAEEAKDSVLNLCGEYDAFEPITWNGVVGDREVVDFSGLTGENIYAVKVSDAILTYEDYLGATITVMTPDGEQAGQIAESDLMPKDMVEQTGMCGTRDAMATIIDVYKANTALETNLFKNPGTYTLYNPEVPAYYVKSLSKTIVKKIDEKFLPEIAPHTNMEKGVGENATQQIPRPDKVNLTNATGQLCFEGDNPFVIDQLVPYGALGKSSTSLCGRTSAQATHSIAINSKTIAKGEESCATGYATIALGGASFSGGSQTIARAEASTALGHKNDAAAPYTFVHGVQNVAGGLYQAVFGVANENNIDNLFEIGNGKLDESGNVVERVNALAVTRDGRVKVQNLNIEDMEVNDLVPMAVLKREKENLTAAFQAKLNYYQANQYISNGSADGSTKQKYCTASQVGSAAFGTYTHAGAEASLACGAYTRTTHYAQTVVGKYNNLASRDGSVFVVGGGESDSKRKNALEVISDGEIIIYWNDAYYSLNLMLNLISNAHGGPSFFDAAKK